MIMLLFQTLTDYIRVVKNIICTFVVRIPIGVIQLILFIYNILGEQLKVLYSIGFRLGFAAT